MEKCCICGKEYEGIGRTPHPFRITGSCCNVCHEILVRPVHRMFGSRDSFASFIKVCLKYSDLLLDGDEYDWDDESLWIME